MLGIAFGASGAVFARGDSMSALHAMRAWGATALRSLERSPAPPVASTPATAMVTVTANTVRRTDARPKDAPCPVDPGPGDPCAELLAPFATHVPTVSIDDLPRVKPAPVAPIATVAPVVVVGRRLRGAAAPPQPVAQEHEDVPATPRGINPDEDDPQSTPARIVPANPPPVPKAPADPPSSELQSAQNEPT